MVPMFVSRLVDWCLLAFHKLISYYRTLSAESISTTDSNPSAESKSPQQDILLDPNNLSKLRITKIYQSKASFYFKTRTKDKNQKIFNSLFWLRILSLWKVFTSNKYKDFRGRSGSTKLIPIRSTRHNKNVMLRKEPRFQTNFGPLEKNLRETDVLELGFNSKYHIIWEMNGRLVDIILPAYIFQRVFWEKQMLNLINSGSLIKIYHEEGYMKWRISWESPMTAEENELFHEKVSIYYKLKLNQSNLEYII